MFALALAVAASVATTPALPDNFEQEAALCVAHVMDVVAKYPKPSTALDDFLDQTKLPKVEQERLKRQCQFFEAGVGFGISATQPKTTPVSSIN